MMMRMSEWLYASTGLGIGILFDTAGAEVVLLGRCGSLQGHLVNARIGAALLQVQFPMHLIRPEGFPGLPGRYRQ